MNLNRNTFLFYFLLFYFSFISAQENEVKKDSVKTEELEEVIVTGQYSPQSINKSVFEVKVIGRAQIEQQAANNLADVLNQSLNISIIPNGSTGKSSVQLFGLDGRYFKILIDNIPVINDEGLGNNTDLTQLNLDDIEQIEIVEGSMGVQYGANAISGVINIITKKYGKYTWEISPYIQEETVEKEYGFFDKGRHIQSLRVGHNISDRWYANALYTRNDFAGFWDDREGKNHELNDDKRGYLWLPKLQNTAKALVNYRGENGFRSFYKFEYFDENINRFSQVVNPNYNPSTQTSDPVGNDATFTSERFYHHLNFLGKWKTSFNYDVSLSYQQQKRNVETFRYRIKSRQKFDIEKFEYESRKVLYSKGNFSNFLQKESFDFQLGYEVNHIDGYASSSAGTFNGENIKRELGSYDVFGSAEIHVNDKFSIRPGARLLASSAFNAQAAVSLSTRYSFANGLELRGVVGSAPRLPSYAELYTYFVDANHDIRGNEDLVPEQGASIFLHLKKSFDLTGDSNLKMLSKLTLNYLDLSDRIELSVINEAPLQFKYINIDSYKTVGAFLNNSLNYKNLNANIGIGLSGESKVLDSRVLHNDDYLYAMRLNANVSYFAKPIGMVFSAFYKYNGPRQQFVERQNENDEAVLVRGKQDGFSWLDASIRKDFLDRKIQLTLGARNLLDITRVNTTATAGGAHSGPPSTILLGYGRSYFLKLVYNLKF
ncbi:TonB-dependent receptor plug domain-containing protein [Aquimarina aquimarini]|uniref:TonB-dependent receptor plug domain-containing protein n=1 Tax=Aquimarina aquimarini TaxID=1191734 RepID=UPI000D551A55|nr:TonB-dependent receptor plug domain-containing protein [Aquimarina aquimarini]